MTSKYDREFTKGSDRLFESILDLAILHEAFFGHLMTSTKNPPAPPGQYLGLSSQRSDIIIGLPTSYSFYNIVVQDMADRIPLMSIASGPISEGTIPADAGDTTMARTLTRIISPIFLRFYETYLPWWAKQFNGQETWPQTLRFARVVRNAIGHGSTISWDDPKVSPVQWSGVAYSHADNGKRIIGTDLITGDLVRLMVELSDELDGLNCPLQP